MSPPDSPGPGPRPSAVPPPYDDWLQDLYGPLKRVARRRLKGYPAVARWADADDVLHAALLRLMHALLNAQPSSPRHLFALACEEVRRECLDRARRYNGPRWQALHAPGPAPDFELVADRREGPAEPLDWSAFDAALAKFPAADCELLRLFWYEAQTQEQIAARLQVKLRTVQRHWDTLLRQLRAFLTGQG